ncbi:MAG: DUF5615 family PIN-like protein [Allosphingosinicella sp.]
MRFLLDENVPFALLDALVERGHEVTHVARTAVQTQDVDVLALAVRQLAILVTFDSDFGRLIFYERQAPPQGLVYLQARPDGAAETISALLAVLDGGAVDLIGHFVVIDQEAGLRVLPIER